MLDFIRQRAGSWMIKIMLGAIIVVFIFWGVGSFRSRRANLLATVNGQAITYAQYQTLYAQRLEQLQRMFRGQLSDEMLKRLNLPGQIFEELVRRILLESAAKKMGIRVTPDEVRLAISQIHAFQENGRFSPERYQLILRQLRMVPAVFEEEVRVQLLEAKLHQLLTTPIVATTEQAKEFFIFENEGLKIGYVKIPVAECEKEIKVTEEELKKYFESHQEDYRTPLKLKLVYYLLSFDNLKKELKISEQELKEYYESHKDSEFFRPEARKLRHILIAVKPGEDETKAREKAEKILAEIKGPEDVARLAKKYSDDPHTKDEGGELGFVTKKDLFASLQGPVFSAKEGDIIGPIKSPLGYHIILIEKIRPKGYIPFEKVKDKILAHLKDQKVKELAWDRANKIYDEIILLGGLEKWAQKHQVHLEETPLFTLFNPPPGPVSRPQVLKAAKKLEQGELGPPIEVPEGIIIFKLAKRDDPHIPPFKEVKEKVKVDYVAEKARELCEKKAEELLAKLKSASDQEKILKEAGLTRQEKGPFPRKELVDRLGLPTPVAQACQGLGRIGEWIDHPVLAEDAYYLVQLVDLKPADLKQFAQEEKALKARLTREKRDQAFWAWYKRLREKAEIKLYRELPKL